MQKTFKFVAFFKNYRIKIETNNFEISNKILKSKKYDPKGENCFIVYYTPTTRGSQLNYLMTAESFFGWINNCKKYGADITITKTAEDISTSEIWF